MSTAVTISELANDPALVQKLLREWEEEHMSFANDAGLARVTDGNPLRFCKLAESIILHVPENFQLLLTKLILLYDRPGFEWYPDTCDALLARLINARFRFLYTAGNYNETKKPPQILEPTCDLISWAEMAVAALISISFLADNINDGNRGNRGIKDLDPDNHAPSSILVFTVGGRFELLWALESLYLMNTDPERAKTERENELYSWVNTTMTEYLTQSEYHALWGAEEFKDPCLDKGYETGRLPLVSLDHKLYMDRLAIPYHAILDAMMYHDEPNQRVIFPGLGLGNWMHEEGQCWLNVLVILTLLRKGKWPNLHTAVLQWFPIHDQMEIPESVTDATGHLIYLEKDQRNPLEPVPKGQNPQPVVGVAWDGGSAIGNELWDKKLTSSSDPALAVSGSGATTCLPWNPFFRNPNWRVFKLYSKADLFLTRKTDSNFPLSILERWWLTADE